MSGRVGPLPPSFTDNYSLNFDGIDDYIDCGNISALNGLTTATWSCWIRRGGTSAYYLMSSWGTTNVDKQFFSYTTNQQILVYLGDSTTGAQRLMFNSNNLLTITTGTWYHLAIVYNGSEASDADKIKVYLENTPITNQTTGYNIPSLHSVTTNFEIGKIGGYTTNEFNGNIDEVSIFDSIQNVSTLYNLGTPGDLTSLSPLAWYQFEEGSGTTAIDSGTGGNNGTINGATYSTDVPT